MCESEGSSHAVVIRLEDTSGASSLIGGHVSARFLAIAPVFTGHAHILGDGP